MSRSHLTLLATATAHGWTVRREASGDWWCWPPGVAATTGRIPADAIFLGAVTEAALVQLCEELGEDVRNVGAA